MCQIYLLDRAVDSQVIFSKTMIDRNISIYFLFLCRETILTSLLFLRSFFVKKAPMILIFGKSTINKYKYFVRKDKILTLGAMKNVKVISAVSCSFFYLQGLIVYLIPIFKMENIELFPSVQACLHGELGSVSAMSGDVQNTKHFKIIMWEAKIVPLLMLIWALCNMLRVQRFKHSNNSDNWRFRYRQNFVTFTQIYWCHSLILSLHLVLDTLETLYTHTLLGSGVRINLWLLMKAMMVLVENIFVPGYFFYSSWYYFPDLWSDRNTFFFRERKNERFKLVGQIVGPRENIRLHRMGNKYYDKY